MHRIVEVPGWPRPRGYSNGIAARGEWVFVAGQVGWDQAGRMVPGGFAAQFARALENVRAVLSAAGAAPEHLARVTVYVTDVAPYRAALAEVGAQWRRVLGRVYPAMTLVQVAALLEEGALVEIEATAVVPARPRRPPARRRPGPAR